MNEVVQLVQQKTGLSPEMSQRAVETVLGYLKSKLPAPLASHLDSFMSGQQGDSGGLSGQAESMLGGLMGNKE